jgi:hypothetical protein
VQYTINIRRVYIHIHVLDFSVHIHVCIRAEYSYEGPHQSTFSNALAPESDAVACFFVHTSILKPDSLSLSLSLPPFLSFSLSLSLYLSLYLFLSLLTASFIMDFVQKSTKSKQEEEAADEWMRIVTAQDDATRSAE